ncbi:MAG: Excinuclease abc c subunit domain protein [Candidatus Uhrbacteria bacterium GW2011_GWF2_40_263]|nr:MAG: Excinuclease abc c subunit domain protein [Candidatus Uhrbacteria bacterium GW2011_GWF2_40_263]
MPNIPSNWVGTEAVKSRLWRDPATMKRWRGGADIQMRSFCMFSTYVLYSEKFDRYYIGSTSDYEKRLKRHNAGHTKSTKPFRPWVMVYREDFETRTEALKRENQIKRYKRGLAFYKLIQIHG